MRDLWATNTGKMLVGKEYFLLSEAKVQFGSFSSKNRQSSGSFIRINWRVTCLLVIIL